MQHIGLVFLGGGLGAVSRYAVSLLLGAYSTTYPMSTFLVNILGCFAISLCYSLFQNAEMAKLLLITGFLGGFTTMSSFSFEILQLFLQKKYMLAFFHSIVGFILCLVAVVVGYVIGKNF